MNTSPWFALLLFAAAPAGAQLQIVLQPSSLTVGEGHRANFHGYATSGVYDPVDRSVLWGSAVYLYASAYSGVPVTIQWYDNGAQIVGATPQTCPARPTPAFGSPISPRTTPAFSPWSPRTFSVRP